MKWTVSPAAIDCHRVRDGGGWGGALHSIEKVLFSKPLNPILKLISWTPLHKFIFTYRSIDC